MAEGTIVPVILCGGQGARLWPLSRSMSPKQFAPLRDGQSLFDLAVHRAGAVENSDKLLCVTIKEYKHLVQAGLSALGRPGDVLVEPVGRNTAGALCAAALWLNQKHDDAIMVILPSDQIVSCNTTFADAIKVARKGAETGKWMLLGVEPDHPSQNYGYLKPRKNVVENGAGGEVETFAEKPSVDQARQWLEDGWLWHTGIGVVKASTLLEFIKEHLPQVLQTCKAAMEGCTESDDFIHPAAGHYEKVPVAQIDRAVLEKADRLGFVRLGAKWRDVGSWDSYEQLAERVGDGNRFCGDVHLHESNNCYVRSPHRLTVTLGTNDLTIIDTKDALLVAHKGSLGDVGKVAGILKRANRSEVDFHTHVARPWGHYEVISSVPGYKVKKVVVRPGASLSRQFHYHRAEHWIVVAGVATVTRDDEVFELGVEESVHIPKGTIHRLENKTSELLELVEVQTGENISEHDIVRLDDKYGR